MQNNNTTDHQTRGARVGRAVAWFAAGAIGATTLTGVALAATTDTDTTPSGPPAAAEQFRGGKGGPHGRPGGMMSRGGAMVHSEGVTRMPDGEFQNMAGQQGEVTEVTDNSVTVRSEDDFTATYQVNDETRVSKDREQKSIADVKVGDKVRVMAEKDGDTLTAKHVGAMSEELAAEMEKRREEMQEKRAGMRQEMLEEHQQKGDTTRSGFGGPPNFTSEAL